MPSVSPSQSHWCQNVLFSGKKRSGALRQAILFYDFQIIKLGSLQLGSDLPPKIFTQN